MTYIYMYANVGVNTMSTQARIILDISYFEVVYVNYEL